MLIFVFHILVVCLGITGKRQPYLDHYKTINDDFTVHDYQPFHKIEEELKRIGSIQNNNVKRSLFVIGKTFEGRDLLGLKLKNNETIHKKKKVIVVDCGAHAREWIAPATCMYIIEKFSGSCCDDIMQKFDWVFFPVLNPDGYVYTWKNNKTRMWRKNRSYTKEQLEMYNDTHNELCIGTDINRNFDVQWGGVKAPVKNPCFEMYAGSNSFSERESSALAEYLRKAKDIIAYVSLHTYGQYWMTPYGFTKKRPESYEEMKRVASKAVEAMRNFSNVKYLIGPSHDRLYPNSGSSVDWAYKTLSIPYTYIVEMMPSGEDGKKASFLAPPSMMVKNAKDILVGIRTMALNLQDDI